MNDAEKIRRVLKVQGHHGNWNYSEYMLGLYNGLELALSILENERDPEYRSKPDQGFLSERITSANES